MANEFLDKVEDNAIVRIWSEKVQLEKGDSLAKDYVSELWDYTRISVTQNSLQELKEIWDSWANEARQFIMEEIDEHYWNERAVDHIQDQAKWGVQMYSMKESARLDSSTSGWKKEGRSVCFEYLRVSDLP
ncbi:hypothetical protein Gotur_027084 [Gossypium turneri]